MHTVQLFAGILLCNGGKLEEAEDFKYFLVLYWVFILIGIDQLLYVNNNIMVNVC